VVLPAPLGPISPLARPSARVEADAVEQRTSAERLDKLGRWRGSPWAGKYRAGSTGSRLGPAFSQKDPLLSARDAPPGLRLNHQREADTHGDQDPCRHQSQRQDRAHAPWISRALKGRQDHRRPAHPCRASSIKQVWTRAGRLVLMSHLGRARRRFDQRAASSPAPWRLGELLGKPGQSSGPTRW